MIITIGGTAGSGKSSVARLLAKNMGYAFYSAGDLRGEYAAERGMTIEELNKVSRQDPSSDRMADDKIRELAEKQDNFVIDGRMGFFFVPKSVKVYIDAALEVRAERVMKEKRIDESYDDIEAAKHALEERQESDVLRYKKLYSVDISDPAHYDLIVDSSDKTVEQTAGEIYRFVMFKQNEHKRR